MLFKIGALRLAVVAEGAVTVSRRLPHALQCLAREGCAFWRVASDAVKQRPDQLRDVQAHLLVGLADEQLHHMQLIDGQQGTWFGQKM